MNKLDYWHKKIQEKRKSTPFREFIREIGSWISVSFYKNNGCISKYPPSNRVNICPLKEFDNSRDDFPKYGKIYDTNRPFFQQFQELFLSLKLSNVGHIGENENSDFGETVVNSKNVYLSTIVTLESENVFYSLLVRVAAKDVLRSIFVISSEVVYASRNIKDSFKVFYSSQIHNSHDIWFCSDMVGCQECILCDGLENQSYCIQNTQYGKEEYSEKKKELLAQKGLFEKYATMRKTGGKNLNSTEVKNGKFVIESENIENCNSVFNIKDSRNVIFAGSTVGGENWYDFGFGGEGNNDVYATGNCGGGCSHVYCSSLISWSSHLYYCLSMENCSFCLGCVGLKNKSYCIFNTQYTKEEWYEKVDTIFTNMEKEGILGDFFPGSLNPFYFNDTMAGILGDFNKEGIEKLGYMWRNEEIKVDIPKDSEVVNSGDISKFQGWKDGIWNIDTQILKKVIQDTNGDFFRVIPMERDFLEKYGLPLPQLHYLTSIKQLLGGKI